MEKLYALRDIKTGAFDRPVMVSVQIEIERMLVEVVNDPRNQLAKYPEDFELYYLGEYDKQCGRLIQDEPPRFLATLSDYKREEK